MFQPTPQKRVLLGRSRTTDMLTCLLVAGVFLLAASFAAIFSAANPGKATAATNANLNFQARLQTATGGIVADGFYNVEYKLYNAAAIDPGETLIAGSCTTNPGAIADEDCLWTERWYDSNGVTAGNDNRVQVRNGYLTVNLGSQTSFPSTINWDQDLWIGLNIGGLTQTATPTFDGEMTPRLKLTAVPFAFRAAQLVTGNGTLQNTLQLQQATSGSQVYQILDRAAAGTYNLLTNDYISNAAVGTSAVQLQGQTSATAAVLTVKGGATPGAGGDLLQLKNSSNQSLAGFDSSGQLYLGRSGGSGATGSLKVFNSTNANTVTIQSGTTTVGGGSGYTLTLPTGVGSSGDCLKDTTGAGVLGFAACSSAGGATSVAFSTTPNANGGSIAAGVLTLAEASTTSPGLISGNAQTLNGVKTFNSSVNTATGNKYQINAQDILSATALTFRAATAGTIDAAVSQALNMTGNATSTLATTAGALILNGFAGVSLQNNGTTIASLNSTDFTIAANRNLTMASGTGTFSTGTGAVNLNGNTTQANGTDIALRASSGASEDAGDLIFQNNSGTQKARIWTQATAGAPLFFSTGDTVSDLTIDSSGGVAVNTTLQVGGNTTLNGDLAANGAVNGLILNKQYVHNSDGLTHNYKIATLPISGSGSFDHIRMRVTLNDTWTAANNNFIDISFSNRNSFVYQYTLNGDVVNSCATIKAYNNSGVVDIYLSFNGAVCAFTNASYSILENQQVTTYPTPTDVGSPAGTLVFDASSGSYPPSFYTAFNGNSTFGATTSTYRLDVQGGDINTSANVRTGNTIRLDNAGNLSNIGTISASGNITQSGSSTFATASGATTLNGSTTTIGDAASDRLVLTAQVSGGSPIVFQGATDNSFSTTLALVDPTANNTITLPNASGTVAVSATGNIALSAIGQISLTGLVGVANGGTGASSLTANGVLFGNGTGTIGAVAAGSTGQCLVATTSSAPSWGACGVASNLQDAYDGSSTNNPQILLSSTNGGLKVRDNSTPVSGNLFQIQNSGGTATYFGVATSGLTIQNSSAVTLLNFNTSTSTLRIAKTGAAYIDIYHDGSNAYISQATGTLNVGSGTGNVGLTVTGASDVIVATKTATLAGAYSLSDFSITQTLTGGANAISGSVLNVSSASTTSSTNTQNILYLNRQNGTGGNLILAQTGGSTTRFQVTDTGATTASGLVTANGGLTVSGTTGITGTTSINTSGSSITNIGTGTATGNINIGNSSGGTNVAIDSNVSGGGWSVDAAGNLQGLGNIAGSGTYLVDVTNANAFRLRNSGGTVGLINIDSTTTSGASGFNIQLGSATTDANAIRLILDSYNNATDPTGINGAMYYNSSLAKFRCYENSVWKDCIGLDADNQRGTPFYSSDFWEGDTSSAYNSINAPWYYNSMNSGGTVSSTASPSTANHPGVVRLGKTATANGGARYATAGGVSAAKPTTFLLGGGESYEAVFKLVTTTSNTLRFGFADTISQTAGDDGVHIEISGTTLQGRTLSNATSSTTGSTYTVTTGTWYRARVTLNSNASTATFVVYNDTGTQLWTDTLSTNIPTATGRETGAGAWGTNSSASAVDLFDLDYMALWFDDSRTLTR